MKISKPFFLLCLSLIGVLSCRTEDDLSIGTPVEETIEANSNLADLISRTSQNDGSIDNIIDKANCLSVQLPVTVTVNGTQITVDDKDGYEEIEDVFDLFDDDIDIIEISYPITLILTDFTTLTINSDAELIAIADNCPGENEDDDDIECIDFQYPITTFILDENNELVNTIVIDNDEEMHRFIDDLDEYTAVTINFPLSVILADGSTQTIGSVQELENVIENADDTCDEDDDNDFNDDDCDSCTTNQLSDALTACSDWNVDKLERNDQDLEDQYTAYDFNFMADGTLNAVSNTDSFAGTWEASGSANNISVIINIPNLPDFNATWNLHEIQQGDVDFRLGDDRLRFKSDCVSNGGGNGGVDDTALVQALTNGDWYVTNYFDDVDETALFDGMVFNFAADGSATADDSGAITNGTWSTGSGDETELELNLNFGMNVPFDELLEDWDVLEATDDIIRLKDISGGDGTTDFLTFERNASSNGNGGVDLSTVIVDGTWTVSSYLDDGVDETNNFSDYTFNFVADGSVTADNGSATNGIWATENGDNKFVLDFGAVTPLDEFNDDWDVISVSDTQLELRDVSGGSGATDTLIFTKQ
ncbi:hypothetical protein [Flagellimonas sp. 2504JD1-5]